MGVMKVLLDHGADIGPKSVSAGRGPLNSRRKGNIETVKLLLDRGFNAEAKAGHYDLPALMEAAERGNLEVAGLLLDKGADINAKAHNSWGRTPLTLAAHANHLGNGTTPAS